MTVDCWSVPRVQVSNYLNSPPTLKLRRARTILKSTYNMARIAGMDLPRNKRGVISLTYIYGVGPSTAVAILEKAGVDGNAKVENWTDENIKAISGIIADEYKTEGQLRSEVQLNIKRLMDIGCYRGGPSP